MTRGNLCLMGALLLASGAIGWLWRDNQALREQIGHEAQPIENAIGETLGAKVLQVAERKGDPVPERRSESGRTTPRLPEHRSGKGLQPVRAGKPEPGKREAAGDPQAPGADTGKEAAAADTDKRAALLTVVSAAEGEKGDASLFKNGGFEAGLAPWLCKEGKVIQEPGNPANSILEVNPSEGKYRLSQGFRRSASSRHQLLTFRVKTEGEYSNDITVLLGGKDGPAITVYTSLLGKAGKWTDVSIPFDLSPQDFQPVELAIEGKRAETVFWIDDVVLREISSSLAGVQQ